MMQYISGPRWNVSRFRQVVGEDHLGIKYVAINIADWLQTGITSITARARYWSFFTWVLHDFIQTQPNLSESMFKEYLKRQEWFFILANIAESKEREVEINQLAGVTKGLSVWEQEGDTIPCHFDYLQNSLGGLNIYRNVLKVMGLTREGDPEIGVQVDRITPLGYKLAKAFEESIIKTAYFNEWRHSMEPVPRSVLLEYGRVAGLSRLTNNSPEFQLLVDLFLPGGSEEELKQLRYLSLVYYQHIISAHSGMAFNYKEWRKMMYDEYSPSGQGFGSLPESLRPVAIGWEIYQGRQLFTYSLETIWYYLLELIARRSYSVGELMAKVLVDLREMKVDIGKQVTCLMTDLPLSQTKRENFINGMGKKGGNVLDYVYSPLLVLLDVFYRFNKRCDLGNMHKEFIRLGGRDHISLKKWEDDVIEYSSHTIAELLELIIRYYILDQHQKVALNKILTSRNETYHFVENEGKLHFIYPDGPVFNSFRVNQAVFILEDLGFVKRQGEKLSIA